MEPLAVFISYAHADSFDFAHKLKEALRKKGKTLWIDVESIEPGSAFNKVDIPEGIVGSIAVLAIISPASIISEPCKQEREIAKKHGKKIIPILYKKPPDGTEFEHDWIDFSKPEYFDGSLERLLEAIETDLTWKKIHTAIDWRSSLWIESKRKNNSLLMYGRELKEAENKQRGISQYIKPQLTESQSGFLDASRKRVNRSQTIGVIGALLAVVCLTVFSIVAAIQGSIRAGAQRTVVAAQATTTAEFLIRATAQAKAAEGAEIAHARNLAELAVSLRSTDTLVSLLMSAEAFKVDSNFQTRSTLYESTERFPHLFRFFSLEKSPKVGNDYLTPGLAFSPSGMTLATGTKYGTIILWELSTGKSVDILGQPTDADHGISRLAFSPNGKSLASFSGSYSRNGKITVWDTISSQSIFIIDMRDKWITNLAFSPNGQVLVASTQENGIYSWNAYTGQLIPSLTKESEGRYSNFAISPDGKKLASIGLLGRIVIWEMSSGQPLISWRAIAGHIFFSPDGLTIISDDVDHRISFWNASNGRLIRTLAISAPLFAPIEYSPDGKTAVYAKTNGTIELLDLATNQVLMSLYGNLSRGPDFVFSLDGKYLASSNGRAILWDLTSDRSDTQILSGHTGEVMSLAFNPEGKILASGASDHIILLSNVRSGQIIGKFEGPGRVVSLVFSADGKHLTSSHDDGTIIDWDVTRGVAVSSEFDNNFFFVPFYNRLSPDHKYLYHFRDDQTLYLESLEDGKQIDLSREYSDAPILGVMVTLP